MQIPSNRPTSDLLVTQAEKIALRNKYFERECSFSPLRSLVKTTNTTPVSYTPLDVYKRQGMIIDLHLVHCYIVENIYHC